MEKQSCEESKVNTATLEWHDEGYDEVRFENPNPIDSEFYCSICTNVLKEPMQCRNNEHYFCLPCITRHLVISHTCPLCMEVLTPEDLKRPSRIVTNVLSKFTIRCDYAPRGCGAVVELGVLKTHVENCEFSPVPCSNDGCLVTINKRDKLHHETNVCGFRRVKCDDCGEEMMQKKYKTHGCVLKKEVDEIKTDIKEIKVEMKEIVKEMRGMMAEMKEEMKEEMKVAKLATELTEGPPEQDVVVAAGYNYASYQLCSVEMFNWKKRSWAPLPPMKQRRNHHSSFVYQNQVFVAGGFTCTGGATDSIERMTTDQHPDWWHDFPGKLSSNRYGHTSLVYQDGVINIGGYNKDEGKVSDGIYEVLLTAPYTSRLLTHLGTPRTFHGAVTFGDQILIVGGKTSMSTNGSIASVEIYDVNNNRCRQMPELPFALSCMAAVSWKDNVILLGGADKRKNALSTVIMYDIKTGQTTMLPEMRYKRDGCSAVVCGNGIVVMGGQNKQQGDLSSVEYFSFDRYSWEKLPPMIEPRQFPTAIVKPSNLA